MWNGIHFETNSFGTPGRWKERGQAASLEKNNMHNCGYSMILNHWSETYKWWSKRYEQSTPLYRRELTLQVFCAEIYLWKHWEKLVDSLPDGSVTLRAVICIHLKLFNHLSAGTYFTGFLCCNWSWKHWEKLVDSLPDGSVFSMS